MPAWALPLLLPPEKRTSGPAMCLASYTWKEMMRLEVSGMKPEYTIQRRPSVDPCFIDQAPPRERATSALENSPGPDGEFWVQNPLGGPHPHIN